MGCKYAECDIDTGRYDCKVSGDECIYLMPNYEACIKDEYFEEVKEDD